MVREEALCDMGHEVNTKDQVSNFLNRRLKMLSDPDVVWKLTQMLTTCMGEEGTYRAISIPLLERDMF